MIRYFLFNNASLAAAYGVGTHLRHLLQCLKGQSHLDLELVQVELQSNSSSICNAELDDIGVWRLHIPIVNVGMEDGIYNRNAYAEIIHWNEQKETAEQLIFHFHYEQHFLLASLLKAHYPDSQIIYTVHCQTWAFFLKGNQTKLKQLLLSPDGDNPSTKEDDDLRTQVVQSVKLEKRMLAVADRVVVLSDFTRRVITEDYKVDSAKLYLHPNTIPDERVGESFNLDSTYKYILYVGRLDEGKGLGILLHAFSKVHQVIPNSRLIIAGNGDFNNFLAMTEETWPYVSWTGRLNSTELYKLYRSVQVGVLPSFNEQSSYSLIEMLMHGIPVIGTDCSGLKEMLSHSPNCQLPFEQTRDDLEEMISSLTRALTRLLSSPSQLVQEGEKSRKAYEDRYTQHHASQQWKQLLALPPRNITDNRDLLYLLDERCCDIVNQRPDYMDIEMFGLTGLAYYLWWRWTSLNPDIDEERIRRAFIGEHLIYTIDWMAELLAMTTIEEASTKSYIAFFLNQLSQESFYTTVVHQLLKKLNSTAQAPHQTIPEMLANTLSICNYK